MNVVADIGNTQIKIAIERKNGISRVKAFQSDDFTCIKKYLKSLDYDNKPYLFYSSVLGANYDKKLIKTLKSFFEKITTFKSTRSLLSTTNSYKKASSLGSDRWAQIVAAKNIFKKDCIIVSCGSAISIDCVTKNGTHKGGMLMSGAEKYINCFSDIHNLKNISLTQTKKNNLLQTDTAEQINVGYRTMISASVHKVYEEFKKNTKSKPAVIVSGGYARQIASYIEVNTSVEPFFVLKSLAFIKRSM
jgi:type III pantothenate kinase|tara:strand:- start:72 stop:812 length:741 start_codon:yes stop_codon:yes gene_type:complete